MKTTNLYTPIAADLPEIYRSARYSGWESEMPDAQSVRLEDRTADGRTRTSWNQICDYLGLVDGTCREYLNQLIELPSILSPLIYRAAPPGCVGLGDKLALQRRRDEILARLAREYASEFPSSPRWRLDLDAESDHDLARNQEILKRKAELIRRLPRIWRERHTPTGFLRCFCAFFDLEARSPDECPLLLEHYRYRPQVSADQPADRPVARPDDRPEPDKIYDCQFTLLVPQRADFCNYTTARAVDRWIDENAPSHLIARHIFIPLDFWPTLRDDVLPSGTDLRSILAQIDRSVSKASALHVLPRAGGSPPDRADDINLGRLPSRPDAEESEGR